MHHVIRLVLDGGDFLEVQRALRAQNILIGFGRHRGLDGRRRRQQPACSRPACWTSTRLTRRRAFIRFCNAFNIPLLTFVDVPGFMPGVQQEYGGIIRHGAKMLFAYGAATVPEDHDHHAQGLRRRLPGDVRQGAWAPTACCAWPTAEIAVMGAEGAVNVLYRKEIEGGRRSRRPCDGS